MLRADRRAVLALLLCAAACTSHHYVGPPLPREQLATIDVGTAVVREIDGERRRGGTFDVGRFEITPGQHRIELVFELPARTVGMKTVPAQKGEGTCVLEFTAVAAKRYSLGSRPRSETVPHWNGAWEGWLRDPSIDSEDAVIARCASQIPARAAAPATGESPPAPPPVVAQVAPAAAMPVPAPPPAAAVAPAPAVVAAATASPTPRVATIRLGEWNLRSLGHGTDKDYARIAAVIDEHFDILTVIEVVQVAGGHPGYEALLHALGAQWAGMITDTPRPNTAADGAEYYAILYRPDRVRPCAGWDGLRYTPDGDGSGTSNGVDHFLREPAFACFEAGDASAPGVDFLLAAYHAPEGDAGDVAAEVSHFGDVFSAMKLARPGEDDLIIAGDFHLESVELHQVTTATDHTSGGGSVLNLMGERTPSLPDHVVVYDPRATAELLGDAEALDVRGVAPSNAEFYRTMSDHLPIVVRMRATPPDDD
jgi:hypothetical protein